MVHSRLHQHSLNRSQKGVVLIVGLVMVLLISIIALAAIKGSGLQEAMTGNARDRNIAFQAAEGGLTAGEAVVDENLVIIAPVCPSAVCSGDREVFPANSVIYFDETGWTTNTILTTAMALSKKSQPRYIVEELPLYRPDDGSGVDGIGSVTEIVPYRITSRGVGLTAESTAIIQSFYHRSAPN
jgi:type IV pilus assembly protein PilX